MDKSELRKKLIKYSEYYNPNCSYVGALNRNNITTIDQLLNEELMMDIMKQCHRQTRLQLMGFISMLKYKYLDEPLYVDVLLDKEIIIDDGVGYSLMLKNKDEKISVDIINVLGCPRGTGHVLIGTFNHIINNPLLRKDVFPNENIKLIDLFKWMLTVDKPPFRHVYPFVNTYVEMYEKLTNVNYANLNEIARNDLNKLLNGLLQRRKALDNEIDSIRQQLTLLEQNGGIKK